MNNWNNPPPRRFRGAVERWRVREDEAGSRALGYLLAGRCPRRPGPVADGMARSIHFDDGASDLDGRAQLTLFATSAKLRAEPTVRVVIGGVASRSGSIGAAIGIGLRRVRAIQAFLLRQDIDPHRIAVSIRGPGWSLVERPGRPSVAGSPTAVLRIQIVDPHWVLSRN